MPILSQFTNVCKICIIIVTISLSNAIISAQSGRDNPHRRELKGCRGLPAGVWGVPNLFLSLSPPQAAQNREKRKLGHSPKPQVKG
jgi:hypothetical protein